MDDSSASTRSNSLRDDRGRPLAHFDFEAIRAAAREKDDLRAFLDDESSHPSREIGTLWIGIASFFVFACINMGVFWVLFGVLRWPYFAPGSMLLAIVTASLVASAINSPVNRLVRNSIARRRGTMISRMAVKHGICGGCGYPLDSIEREADVCVICPECCAAWKRRLRDITP